MARRARTRDRTAPRGVSPSGDALANIAALIDDGGQITIGQLYPIECATTTAWQCCSADPKRACVISSCVLMTRSPRPGTKRSSSTRSTRRCRQDGPERTVTTQVSQDAGTLSEDYKASVRAGKISRNHGGNRAIWDTVGANASQPNLGTPPKVEPIGEWHFGKDGVPVMGRPPNPETPAKPAMAETDGRSRTDQDGKPGKR